MKKEGCIWPGEDQLMIEYHDQEWGRPLHDDQKFFEFLILDTFQAGLSWRTILHKREHFRKAFHNFDPVRISQIKSVEIENLMQNAGIIRNRLKINATVTNAQSFLKIQQEYGSFDAYIWQFTNGKTIQNHFQSPEEIPTSSKESDAMSKSLKKNGFTFVGTTICYAFMQASGMVNDHLQACPLYKKYRVD